MHWNWVDTLLLACFIWPLHSGFRACLIANLLKTVCLLAGVLMGVPTAPRLAHHIGLFLPANLRTVLDFGAFVAAFWGLGRLVTYLWRTTLGFTPLGLIDRVMGVILGFVKGLLFAVVMAAFLIFAFPSTARTVGSSWLGCHLSGGHWAAAVSWAAARMPR